jgi:hypothetical protein
MIEFLNVIELVSEKYIINKKEFVIIQKVEI